MRLRINRKGFSEWSNIRFHSFRQNSIWGA
uniref:Uncharacterized protein n=1 Tax=Siphoviridae sp. ctsYb1 TaxID=2825696 RepID=A0A8S5VID0_9CAUD|nr:MAG TPA: hypothetical protein [Siphoviridae sp. ctsYb1]